MKKENIINVLNVGDEVYFATRWFDENFLYYKAKTTEKNGSSIYFRSEGSGLEYRCDKFGHVDRIAFGFQGILFPDRESAEAHKQSMIDAEAMMVKEDYVKKHMYYLTGDEVNELYDNIKMRIKEKAKA